MTLSECWWVDENPWPGPKSTAVLYLAFPRGTVNVGDLYLNSDRNPQILYRLQLRHKGHSDVQFLDWEIVARGIEEVSAYLDAYGL